MIKKNDKLEVVEGIPAHGIKPGDNPGVQREGLVFKNEYSDMSFKAVSNEYLLATGK